jgi:hypothetical protein
MSILRRALAWTVPAAAVGLAAALLLAGSAQAGPGFQDVRQATVAFHDVAAANDAGYFDNALPCFTSDAGGMGEHLINGDLLFDGGALDALHPEALVYQVRRNGSWRFVGVEYAVPFTDAPADGPAPALFGQDFSQNTDLGLWTLHAWIWQGNPVGILQTWNPALDSCRG